MFRCTFTQTFGALALTWFVTSFLGCSRSEVSTSIYVDGGAPIGLREGGVVEDGTDEEEPTLPQPDPTGAVPAPTTNPTPPVTPATAPMPTAAPTAMPSVCDAAQAGVCVGVASRTSRCDGNQLVVCGIDPDGCPYEESSELNAACGMLTGTEANCSDAADDDDDGLTDCADADCALQPECREICDNGEDDDDDGSTDCDDADCLDRAPCDVCQPDDDLPPDFLTLPIATPSELPGAETASCSDVSGRAQTTYGWQAPESGCVSFAVAAAEAEVVLRVSGPCPEAELYTCADNANGEPVTQVALQLAQSEEVVLGIDAYDDAPEASFELSIDRCLEDCTDAEDNDLDGLIDCADPDCQMDAACVLEDCDNAVDDNGDGAIDCADPQCVGADYCVCSSAVGLASSSGPVAAGSTVGLDNYVAASCGGSESPEAVFRWSPAVAGCYDLDTFGSDFDTALHVRTDCPDFTELACSDDELDDGIGDSEDQQSRVRLQLEAGTPYIIVIDGFAQSDVGNYVLNLTPCVETCDSGVDDDLDGFEDCADSDCATFPACITEVCDNALDDDGDGRTDCLDTECVLEPVCDEICDDATDNDADTLVDCDDPECSGDPLCFVCPEADANLESATGDAVFTALTTGAGPDVSATCAGEALSEDLLVSWTALTSGCYRFDLSGSDYDTALHIHSECPLFEQLACDDDDGSGFSSRVDLEVTAGTTYLIALDGFGETNTGTVELSIDPCP